MITQKKELIPFLMRELKLSKEELITLMKEKKGEYKGKIDDLGILIIICHEKLRLNPAELKKCMICESRYNTNEKVCSEKCLEKLREIRSK